MVIIFSVSGLFMRRFTPNAFSNRSSEKIIVEITSTISRSIAPAANGPAMPMPVTNNAVKIRMKMSGINRVRWLRMSVCSIH